MSLKDTSSFGPVGVHRKRKEMCKDCWDEVYHRLHGTVFGQNYRMRCVAGHKLPKFRTVVTYSKMRLRGIEP